MHIWALHFGQTAKRAQCPPSETPRDGDRVGRTKEISLREERTFHNLSSVSLLPSSSRTGLRSDGIGRSLRADLGFSQIKLCHARGAAPQVAVREEEEEGGATYAHVTDSGGARARTDMHAYDVALTDQGKSRNFGTKPLRIEAPQWRRAKWAFRWTDGRTDGRRGRVQMMALHSFLPSSVIISDTKNLFNDTIEQR